MSGSSDLMDIDKENKKGKSYDYIKPGKLTLSLPVIRTAGHNKPRDFPCDPLCGSCKRPQFNHAFKTIHVLFFTDMENRIIFISNAENRLSNESITQKAI